MIYFTDELRLDEFTTAQYIKDIEEDNNPLIDICMSMFKWDREQAKKWMIDIMRGNWPNLKRWTVL